MRVKFAFLQRGASLLMMMSSSNNNSDNESNKTALKTVQDVK